MTAMKYVTLWCDATVEVEAEGAAGGVETGPCHMHIETEFERVADARDNSVGFGWTYRQGKDRCPQHSGHEPEEVVEYEGS